MITSKTETKEDDVVRPTNPSYITWEQLSKLLQDNSEQRALEALVSHVLGNNLPCIVSKRYEAIGDEDPSVVLQLFGLTYAECETLANSIPPAWARITARLDQHGTYNVWLLSRKRLMKLLISDGGIENE